VPQEQFDAIILAVAHNEFLKIDFSQLKKDCSVVYDVKGILPRDIIDGRL
jgi:UDP-N-acetyl-D-galactosamine dehydrogenase